MNDIAIDATTGDVAVKRNTIFRGKPFTENTYWQRDADIIQEAIRTVCGLEDIPQEKTKLVPFEKHSSCVLDLPFQWKAWLSTFNVLKQKKLSALFLRYT